MVEGDEGRTVHGRALDLIVIWLKLKSVVGSVVKCILKAWKEARVHVGYAAPSLIQTQSPDFPNTVHTI